MNDWAIVLFVPNPGFMVMFAGVVYQLWFMVTPETVAHMRSKFGAKYEAYAKETPSLLIPGVY